MRFTELLAHLPAPVVASGEAEIVSPVTDRAQDVQPGGVFVARAGAVTDGHDLIPLAVSNGAAAVVGERLAAQVNCPVPYAAVPDAKATLGLLAAAYHAFPSRKMIVIGVTGTDGKTTTVTLIHSILMAAGLRAGMINTVKAVLGDAEASTGLHVTTPGAPEVQGYLAQMASAGLTHCVLETTSHGLAQGRLEGVDFDVAVLTNVTHEHLDFHTTWEAYREAKARLFWKLSQTARKPGQCKIAVINADDSSADYFAAIPADQHLLYSVDSLHADLRAEHVVVTPDEVRFCVGKSLQVCSRLPRFNIPNLLAAVGVGIGLGIPAEAIARGIADAPPIPGRMERIDEGQSFLAYVDFAHTPHALRQALGTARELVGPGGRVIAVFGSAGLRDPAKRRMMAEVAAALADVTVLTAEDPRTESLDAILEDMAEGCRQGGLVEGDTFFRVPDRGEALYRAVQMARPGDLVIACGKGHEQSMCFGAVEYPWDDREALRAALHGTPLQTLPTARQQG